MTYVAQTKSKNGMPFYTNDFDFPPQSRDAASDDFDHQGIDAAVHTERRHLQIS